MGFDELLHSAEQEWTAGWLAGPVRIRWTELPVQPGDAAPDVQLLDHEGGVVRLSDSWQAGPALLLFWRQFGCSCGMGRAARLRDELAAYRDTGAEVVIVGQGEPPRAKVYREQQGLPVRFLCDPERGAYRAYGLLEGKPSQILFDAPDEFLRREASAGEGLQDSRRGTPRALVDDPWQLPGEFVVDTGGEIRLAYRYQYCEDYPDPRVLISAIKEAIWET